MPDYKKLLVWTKAKDLAVAVYKAVGRNTVARDFGLRDQMLRAAVSVASNIAEGYARETAADRSNFLNVARGSCAELETQLDIAAEAGLMGADEALALRAASEEISRMLYALKARIRNE
jgi:four helix bundle protein